MANGLDVRLARLELHHAGHVGAGDYRGQLSDAELEAELRRMLRQGVLATDGAGHWTPGPEMRAEDDLTPEIARILSTATPPIVPE